MSETKTITPLSPPGRIGELSRSVSAMSTDSNSSVKTEDWDRSLTNAASPITPPSTTRPLPEGTPHAIAGRTGKSLQELLRLYASGKGKDLDLTEDEQKRLSDELASWVNSDESTLDALDDDEGILDKSILNGAKEQESKKEQKS